MSWWQTLIIVAATLVVSAMFTFVARLSLIQTFGEHLYDRKFGSRVTEQTYEHNINPTIKTERMNEHGEPTY